MKIGSISSVDMLSSLTSVAKINDDDKKKREITIPVYGYKKKHAKLILKFNKFVSKFYKGEAEGDELNNTSSEETSKEKGLDTNNVFIKKVIFHKNISEENCKNIDELLSELNRFNDEIESPGRLILNPENVDEFIEMLRQLRNNDLYFGFKPSHLKGMPGTIIDFRA